MGKESLQGAKYRRFRADSKVSPGDIPVARLSSGMSRVKKLERIRGSGRLKEVVGNRGIDDLAASTGLDRRIRPSAEGSCH